MRVVLSSGQVSLLLGHSCPALSYRLSLRSEEWRGTGRVVRMEETSPRPRGSVIVVRSGPTLPTRNADRLTYNSYQHSQSGPASGQDWTAARQVGGYGWRSESGSDSPPDLTDE